ncbi:MAG: MBL fold metallo-hydrolase [Hyphomicrobiaceae bacterium]|nr:MBL fold metallo-hydrolase [Hyphomicrobiaceae bacterium]
MTRRRFLKRSLAAGMVVAAGAATLMPRKANAYYSGPPSDHFDGTRFYNPGGRSPKGLADVARLYALEDWSPWPVVVASPNPPDRPPAQVTGGSARLVLVGHASWLVQAGGRNILIDPVWAEQAGPTRFIGPRRANPPGIAFDDLPQIHAVLVTHNHYDHMDLDTIARLWRRHRPVIVTPLGNDTIMREAIPDLATRAVDWGDATDLGGIVAHCVPTQHWSARGARDRHHALWASFVLETPAGRIYAVGDSGLGDGRTFRHVGGRFPGLRMALLPIGAYEPRWFMESQHLNPADAVQAFRLCGAADALGHHWGTFQLTTEPHDQPPAHLQRELMLAGIAPERFQALSAGGVTVI